jgi:benzoyl-CoA reductase subunit B
MLHVPYQGDGVITDSMREYVVDQLKRKVIPALERISGKKYDEERLREHLARSAKAEDDLVWVLESAKHRPSPIDAYFGGVYYIGPIFTAFRGTEDAIEYYRELRAEVEERMRPRQGPGHARRRARGGALPRRRRGPAQLDQLPRVLEDVRRRGRGRRRLDLHEGRRRLRRRLPARPDRPLETLAEYCLGCYTNLNLPTRVEMLCATSSDYEADGFLINSVKSCNSFSAGQLMILREVEKRTGKPGGFIESDLVDPRYFSARTSRTASSRTSR